MEELTRRGSLLDILRETGLEQYYDAFHQRGVRNSKNMAVLTMQEYSSLGITSMEDRQRLFELVQKLKTPVKGGEKQDNDHKTPRRSSSFGRRKSLSTSRGRLNKVSDSDERKQNYNNQSDSKITPLKRAKTFTAHSRNDINNTENVSPSELGLKKAQSSLSSRTSPTRRQPSFKQQQMDSTSPGAKFNYGVPSAIIGPTMSKASVIQQHGTLGPRIRVCVRKRPLSLSEKQMGEIDITDITDNHTVVINAPKVSVDLSKFIQQYKFVIDEALDDKCSNEEVYERTAKPLIQTIFNRGKATCFAYGCTGSGKTYTMMGTNDVLGIYLLAAQDIFTTIHSGNYFKGISVFISFFEIYCGQLFDLLCDRKKVFAREDANHQVCITGLTERWVQNTEQLMDVIEYGNSVRSTGATGVNADSSRSHAIVQIELKLPGNKKIGRISFIDLAGSERAADVTDTDKQTRMEGAEINQSLLALKECIRALDLDSKHTPFRQSKLTQVLKDSFIGNCQTCMIANISPSMGSCENTLNTLRYADRVKEMKKECNQTEVSRQECEGNTQIFEVGRENVQQPQIQAAKDGYSLPQVRESENNELSVENNPKWLKRSLEQLKSKMACRNTEIIPSSVMTSEEESTLPVREELKRPATSPAVSENPRESLILSQEVNSINSQKRNPSKGRRNIPMLAPSVCKKRELLNERLRELNQDLKLLPSKSLNNLMDWNSEEDLLSDRTDRQSKNPKFMCTNHSDHTTAVLQTKGQTKLLKSESIKKKKPQGIVRPNTVHTSMQHKEENTNKNSTHKQETKGRYINRTPPQTPNHRYGNRKTTSPNNCHNTPSNKGVLSQQRIDDGNQYSRDSAEAFLAQEQLVSAHQTQLAQVTRLCKQEMELLREADSNRENFEEYIGQLDEILAQKMCSIAALRHMIAGFSSD